MWSGEVGKTRLDQSLSQASWGPLTCKVSSSELADTGHFSPLVRPSRPQAEWGVVSPSQAALIGSSDGLVEAADSISLIWFCSKEGLDTSMPGVWNP